MQRLVIGDIHGCWAEFQDLLDLAGLSDGDEIIALGDMVDRGPATPHVLHFFQSAGNARSLLGNHERKHVRSSRGELKPALSQVISRRQFGDRYPQAVAFMQTLPLFIDEPEAVLVHGFWEPGLALAEQKDIVLAGVMSGERYLQARYGWRWYDYYDGAKPVIVGHRHYTNDGQPLVVNDRVWAIDTGCVRGGRLTGLLLPGFRLVSVPARDNHWHTVSRAFLASQGLRPDEVDAHLGGGESEG